jgi:hypothetical protein
MSTMVAVAAKISFFTAKSQGYIPSKTAQELCKNGSIFEMC